MKYHEYRRLVHAGKEEKMAGDRIYRLERHVSARISWVIVHIFPWISANQLTVFAIFLEWFVLLAPLHSMGERYPLWFGGIALLVLYVVGQLDKIDGEVARYNKQCTQRGIYYDKLLHFFYPVAFFSAMGSVLQALSGQQIWMLLGFFIGLLSLARFGFNDAKISIGRKIHAEQISVQDPVSDEMIEMRRQRPGILVRVFDYWTYMIYTWTLFYYGVVFLIAISYPHWGIRFMQIHFLVMVISHVYLLLYRYPFQHLFGKKYLSEKK